ncbi:MFS transporter [Halogeometricum limi]|uniref:Predicted arabinose efflux permease, MFS family n=1 Tax=Halogeometricum limi TaxID=555875 RepID=A0A1I6GKA9_9EURY|nr:MFS transporter [Halogeometricum limi]SFR42581.1 Predicted arabinose efflux permease, MFS family [Halogeometricum limi]
MSDSPFSLDALRGFPRPVYAVAAGQLVNLFGSGLVYPFATLHFHLAVGIPLAVVGVGLLANNVATAAGTVVGGYLADRRGRKPVMVASMALSSVTLAAYTLVRSGSGFVAVAAAAGLTLGLYTPASHATVADLTDGSDRDRAFALLKVGNNAGFGAGFVVGGVLYEVAELSVFVLDGLTCAVVAGILWYGLPRLHAGDADAALRDAVGDWGRALTERRLLLLALLNVGFAVMYAQMQTTVPVVADEVLGLTSSELGTLYVLNPLVIVLFQLPLVAAVADWRRTRGLVVSASLWAASMLAVAAVGSVSPTLGVALVGAFLVLRTLGEILHAPLVTSLASSLGRVEDRGSQLSLIEVAKRLGFGLGSVVGGAFFDAGLASLLWPTLAGVSGLLAVGVLLLERRVSPGENGAAASS